MKNFDELFGDVENKKLLRHFYDLSQVPRPTEHEEKISRFMESYGHDLGLESRMDPVGNVTIIKPASAGLEDHPAVILQAHMDMVPETRPDVQHDWLHDPIELIRDGDKVMANGTTLGGDDGYGIAMIMTILEDRSLRHPRIEAVFTVHEETDMLGAKSYDLQALQGKKMINLDACAVQVSGSGEKELIIHEKIDWESAPADYQAWQLVIGGLIGGHSGRNAMAERENAIVLAGRILRTWLKEGVHFLIEDAKGGGELSSAIPRDCRFLVCIKPDDIAMAEEIVARKAMKFEKEDEGRDPDIFVHFIRTADLPHRVMSTDCTSRLIQLLTVLPDGVMTRNHQVEGAMECCNNVGILQVDREYATVKTLTRSANVIRKAFVISKIETIADILGMEIEYGRDLPHWQYKISEEFLEHIRSVYDDKVIAAYPGTLEMGYFSEKDPDLELVALCGHQVNAHSPEEYFLISDMEKYYDRLIRLLESL